MGQFDNVEADNDSVYFASNDDNDFDFQRNFTLKVKIIILTIYLNNMMRRDVFLQLFPFQSIVDGCIGLST